MAFSHDIKAAMLVFYSNETAVMLVCQTSHVRVEFFAIVNTFFCFNKFVWLLNT